LNGRTRFLTLTACGWLAFLSFGLLGCGKGKDRAELVFANAVEPQTLDPAIITGQAEGRLANALFEGLMRLNAKGRPEPGVAERFTLSEDGRIYTFYLRENARWSNGDPVTASDFFNSWERVLNPKTAAEYAYQLHYIENAKAYNEGKITDFSKVGIKVLQPYVLEVRLTHPTPFFLDLCAFVTTFPVHLPTVKRYGEEWLKPEKIVTNGAFLLKEWRLNDRIWLDKNPTYWDASAVSLKTVEVLPITNPNTAFNFYYTGGVDLIMDKSLVPLGLVTQLQARPDFHTAPYLGNFFFRFNVTRKPFQDARVRKAISMAINKSLIVNKITRSKELPAESFVPPGIQGYQPYGGTGYHPEKARALLAEAGYPGGKGFPLVDYLMNETPLSEMIGVEIKEMLDKELGIKLALRKQEWKVYLSALANLEFDLARSNWVGDYADPNTFLDMFITGGGNNRTGWSHPEYDRLLNQAAQELNTEKRFEFFRAAERIVVEEEAPICPLYFPVGIQIYDAEKWGGIEANVLDEHPIRSIYRKK